MVYKPPLTSTASELPRPHNALCFHHSHVGPVPSAPWPWNTLKPGVVLKTPVPRSADQLPLPLLRSLLSLMVTQHWLQRHPPAWRLGHPIPALSLPLPVGLGRQGCVLSHCLLADQHGAGHMGSAEQAFDKWMDTITRTSVQMKPYEIADI